MRSAGAVTSIIGPGVRASAGSFLPAGDDVLPHEAPLTHSVSATRAQKRAGVVEGGIELVADFTNVSPPRRRLVLW